MRLDDSKEVDLNVIEAVVNSKRLVQGLKSRVLDTS